uniref:Uncharacterized protein n=1 Tax=Arundo donax TaxID=35708 RepID=A0A0A9B8M8_ARUDO
MIHIYLCPTSLASIYFMNMIVEVV